ncbi:putative membrane protein [Bacteroides fragilis str. 3397 T10]|nr:putative membrane protein [Bacteroides fragilis str. 3397 T10]
MNGEQAVLSARCSLLTVCCLSVIASVMFVVYCLENKK